jgi:beta-1,2-mannosidase
MRLLHLIALASLASCTASKPSVPLSGWTKPAENPIIKADPSFVFYCPVNRDTIHWQHADVFNPAAIVRNGKIHVLYRCEDNPRATLGGRTSRIGLAVSEDGIHFTKRSEPVLYPEPGADMEWDYPGGCEDPRVVEAPDGTYVMTYTSWNGQVARLTTAFSRDLEHWSKNGPVFAKAYGGKFNKDWSKSGSIITSMQGGRPKALRIHGRFWMYWGEHFVNLAWSENLADWTPLVDAKGDLVQAVRTRPGKFDSDLTECGPPALLTDKGILLLFNGRNATDERADPNIPKGAYCVGWMLFDPKDPSKLLSRAEQPFLKPSLPHEVTGQYQAGTTFSEGLVRYQNRWWLYYGTADSFVGLATHD